MMTPSELLLHSKHSHPSPEYPKTLLSSTGFSSLQACRRGPATPSQPGSCSVEAFPSIKAPNLAPSSRTPPAPPAPPAPTRANARRPRPSHALWPNPRLFGPWRSVGLGRHLHGVEAVGQRSEWRTIDQTGNPKSQLGGIQTITNVYTKPLNTRVSSFFGSKTAAWVQNPTKPTVFGTD